MGRDFTLSDNHPSVIINGTKYHYGIDIHRQYMVESAHYEKDYWYFPEREDLQAFLINLPESANHRARIAAAYPDWHEVTPEQRDAYLAEDRTRQRMLAAEKLLAGTAPQLSMDLEGEHGPHEPQRIEAVSAGTPLERVERQLAAHKALAAVETRRPGDPIELGAWPGGATEALKLRVLEGEMDWTGVAAGDKETILAREVDFAGITPEQFDFVYEDIADDKMEPADPAVARALFDRARAQAGTRPLRDTTRNLVESVLLDVWPRAAAVVDFGITTREHYEALYYPLRHGDITPEQVDAASGKGRMLTELVNSAPHNPHQGIEFRTSWDGLMPEPPDPSSGGKPTGQPTLSEIVNSKPTPAAAPEDGKRPEKDTGLEI